jgi:hypothetical protein
MLDVFLCTNLVNYTVALRGAQAGRHRPALLLYEPWRFRSQPVARGRHLPINVWSLRLVKLLCTLGLVDTLHLPHDRFNKRVAAAARRARRVAYLDDGLDTLRRRPRNFDEAPVHAHARPDYFTFADYRQLPDWLQRFNVRPLARLLQLAETSSREPMPLQDTDHVFFESPGLQPAGVIEALALDPARVLVVRHPVPAKRSPLPDGCRTVAGADFNAEATLLDARGKCFYFGETMVLVFALHTEAARRNTILAQLDELQQANLSSLGLVPAGVEGLPQLLKPAAGAGSPTTA